MPETLALSREVALFLEHIRPDAPVHRGDQPSLVSLLAHQRQRRTFCGCSSNLVVHFLLSAEVDHLAVAWFTHF